ncbi:hypothetical protein BDR03DRAFT_940253, partial [Suillus americanus]
MSDIVDNFVFYALLTTLPHSAECIADGMLDRGYDFDRKARLWFALNVTGLL